jgi:VWFA-related protein
VLTPTRSRPSGSVVALLLTLSGVLLVAGPQQSQPSSQPPPQFKAGTAFVRVDAYPTHDGVPVDDLTAADFRITEDGVAQKIETFERIVVQPASSGERKNPSSPTMAAQLVADPHRRVFVIYLDTGGTDVVGSFSIKQPLINLLTQILGPDDLVGLMTPDMSPDAVTFGGKTEVIEEGLQRAWTWGRRNSIMLNEREALYEQCWPPLPGESAPSGVSARAKEMIDRYRERVAFDSLRDLIFHMGALREGRTAVVAVSEGWILYPKNMSLTDARIDPTTGKPVDPNPGTPPPVGVGPGGTLVTNPHPYDNAARSECDRDQMDLAQTDNNQYFRDLLDDANRANVSFYPVDPRGLRAFDSDMGPEPPLPLALDRAVLNQRLDTLRMMADNTDGIALINSNDLTGQMRRLAADLTSYYLMGYSSTNTKLDGRFRTIKVRVNRPGVDVRARHGYRAATAAELAKAQQNAATTVSPATAALNAELGQLAREGRPQGATPARSSSAPDVAGEPIMFRRGPSTGNLLQRATGREFSRTERLHIEMLPGEATTWTGALLDRTGKTLPIPVTTGERTDTASGQKWLIADLILAPLGAGDYAIELTVQRGGEPVKILKAIRVTQ